MFNHQVKVQSRILIAFRSLTLGQTVTVLDGTQTQVHTTGLFWDYMRGHLLYVDKYYYEVRLRVLDTGEDLYISLGTFLLSKA